jgi:hypothetical protein
MRKLGLNVAVALAAAIVFSAIVTPSPARACDRLWVAGVGLWLAQGDQVRLVASDEHGVFWPRFSPAGDRIAYAHEAGLDNGARPEVVILNDAGQVQRMLAIPRDSPVNAILQIGWRDQRHVFAEGHVNPSTSQYVEWDVDSGRVVDEKVGSWFAVSPNGRLVAQRANVPHGSPPPYDGSTLLINDKVVYPAEGDSSYHRFAGPFAWSPDSSRVALAERPDAATEIVVANATGGVVTRASIATNAPVDLSWTGPGTLMIRSGTEAWRLDTASGKAERMPRASISSTSVAPPAALRERFRDVKVRAEDSRCRQ